MGAVRFQSGRAAHLAPSRRRWTAVVVVAVLVVIAIAATYRSWKRGTPYQPASWSPNGNYYVQKFSNLTFSRLVPGMPGHGSDSVDGFIRLYDRNGHLIHERFVHFIRDIEPLWAERRVYLRGVADMDSDPWILPSPAE
jgi:hypothetical protein